MTAQPTMPDIIAKLMEAAKKEVFRQAEALFNTVEPRLLDSVEEAESSLDGDRFLQMADEFNRARPAMIEAFIAKWNQIHTDFNQSEEEYKARLKATGFSLVTDDTLEDKIEIQNLIADNASALNYVLVPVASGLAQALPDKLVNHSTIPFFPQSVGDCVQMSLTTADFNPYLDNLIREMVRDVFFPSMKHLYLGIRKQLEAQGLHLEEASVRSRSDQRQSAGTRQASSGNRFIEVPEDLDLNVLELLKSAKVPADLLSGANKPRLSAVPTNIGDDKSIVTISNKDVDNMLATLQSLGQQQSDTSGINVQQSLAENLQQRSSDTQYNVMSQMGENIINLVALMFEFIQNDSSIPAVVSSLLMRLQIPYMRMTLADSELFENSEHPARLLLNNLTQLGLLATTKESKPYKIIQECVTTLTDNFENSREQVSGLQSDISDFLLQITESAIEQELEIEEQAKRDAEQEEKLEEADAAVKEFVVEPISRIKNPMIFHALLEKVWSQVLHQIYLNYLPLTDERSEAIELFEKVLWSTGAGKNTLLKPDLIKALPDIVTRIDTIFEQCQIDNLIQSHFLDQLQEIHMACIRNADGKRIKAINEEALPQTTKTKEIVGKLAQEKAVKEQQQQQQQALLLAQKNDMAVGHDFIKPEADVIEEPIQLLAPASFETQDAVAVEEKTTDKEQVQDTDPGVDLEFTYSESTPASPPVNNDLSKSSRLTMSETLAQLERIGTGTQMDYMIKGEFKRCKVAFHAPSIGKYIFTDPHGFKLFDRIRAELMVDIQDGYAKVLKNNATFDRALESVVASIRNQRSKVA